MAFATAPPTSSGASGGLSIMGSPGSSETPGWITGSVARLVEGGDHLLVLVSVRHVEVAESAPLAYARRRFGTHSALVPEPAPVRLQGSGPDRGDGLSHADPPLVGLADR